MTKRFDPVDTRDDMLLAELNRRLFHAFRIFGRVITEAGWPHESTACGEDGDLPSRIASLASMHLLLSDTPEAESFEDHCQAIGRLLLESIGRRDVTVAVEMSDLPLSGRQRFRLSLLVAEMVNHVINEWLVDGWPGHIRVELRATAYGGELVVGGGMRDLGPAPASVDCLARSLLGRASLKDGFVSVRFPVLATIEGDPSARRTPPSWRRDHPSFRQAQLASALGPS